MIDLKIENTRRIFFEMNMSSLLILQAVVISFLLLSFVGANAQNGVRKWGSIINMNSINSEMDDFAPHYNLYQSLLYFNSDRTGKTYFYVVKLDNDETDTLPKLLKSDINDLGANQSYITSPSKDEAYFSKYRKGVNQSYLNIYRTVYHKQNWTNPFPVDSLAIDAFCSHVTVSPDGDVMVFASTRNSNENDIDLWMSYRNENGNWGAPFSIDELNSRGNEITPFLHSSDTLYFASDGYEGPGGYDLFFSTRADNKWDRPRPLHHFNTEFDESDFTILPDGNAVFASNRPGGKGKLDLYLAKVLIEQPDNMYERFEDISIRTQVSNIVAEKRSVIRQFPSLYFFFKESFGTNIVHKGKILDSLIFNNHDNVANFLRSNPMEKLLIDSCEYNPQITVFFASRGIDDSRIKFRKPAINSDIIYFNTESGNPLPILESSTDNYSNKPPVIEFSVESRTSQIPGIHNLNIITNHSNHNIELKSNKLPIRDMISLEEYDDEIFNSDSIIIRYLILSDRQTIANSHRVLHVSRQETKENEYHEENNRLFTTFYFLIPEESFEVSNLFPSNYIDAIRSNLRPYSEFKIHYYNDSLYKAASKLNSIILDGLDKRKYKSSIVKLNHKENVIFSRDLSDIVLKVVVYK